MQYPIKYIENNLVWNHDGECFAYYELKWALGQSELHPVK